MAGKLYIVATPIGNLGDITLRAIETLKASDLIAAEDTRQTKVLLERYGIKTPSTSYHKFNVKEKTKHIIGQLQAGKTISLVSDAGMPGISDPGEELVKEAIENKIEVIPIPGASAAITALSVSGLSTKRFVFEGFLPREGKNRRRVLRELVGEERTIVFYESPHRLIKSLNDMLAVLGDRKICVAREMTKKFEEVFRGTIKEAIEHFSAKEVLGEITVIIEALKTTK